MKTPLERVSESFSAAVDWAKEGVLKVAGSAKSVVGLDSKCRSNDYLYSNLCLRFREVMTIGGWD